MTPDISIFLTKENIIFFCIVGLLFLIIFAVFVIFVKFLIYIFKKLFGIKEKSEDEKLKVVVNEPTEVVVEQALLKSKEIPTPATVSQKIDYSNAPSQKSSYKNVSQKTENQNFKEKEKQNITAGLEKLQKNNPANPLGKKEADEKDSILGSKIKLPRAKPLASATGTVVAGPKLDYSNSNAPSPKLTAKDVPQKTNNSSFEKQVLVAGIKKTQVNEMPALEFGKEPVNKMENKANEIVSALGTEQKAGKANSNPKNFSMFGGKKEVSRIDLRTKLRRDPKIWKAQRQMGLNLNPLERVKLEKEVFATAYGRNISKTDLKQSLKKLNQKMLSEKNMAQHAKLRKEIKFFKKIGGI